MQLIHFHTSDQRSHANLDVNLNSGWHLNVHRCTLKRKWLHFKNSKPLSSNFDVDDDPLLVIYNLRPKSIVGTSQYSHGDNHKTKFYQKSEKYFGFLVVL